MFITIDGLDNRSFTHISHHPQMLRWAVDWKKELQNIEIINSKYKGQTRAKKEKGMFSFSFT